MKITKHAQSCFLIETNGKRILLDPGNYVFEKEGVRAEDLEKIDLIAVTHEHADHLDLENVKKIIEKYHPVVIGSIPAAQAVRVEFPNDDIRALIDGMTFEFDGFSVTGLHSKHGPLPNGNPAPEVCGIVIDDGKIRFYTPGDSLYLNRAANADVIGVPFCGHVVMDIAEAKKELLELKPKIAIPIHYDSPLFPIKVEDFVEAMVDTGINVKVLGYGESIEA